MPTLLLSHPASYAHVMPPGHPERPERMRAVETALADPRFAALVRDDAPLGQLDSVALCHGDHYIDELRHVAPTTGLVYIDGDTSMSPGTWEAALRGVGGAVAATDAVLRGHATNAFVATRPPGHHAEINKPMGFCFFGNAAIAARHAQRVHGIGRVAVVDFDVHHGNGTQAAFDGEEGLFFASIQQWPMWPGSGHPSEQTAPNVVNAVSPEGAPREVWRRAFETLMPAVDAFAPDLILISAGFDAHVRDPLGGGGQALEAEDFAWATRAIASVANSRAKGRVVSSLEGGYDLEALGSSAVAHVRALSEG